MSYENPKQPEHINVSTEHPLKEFFLLLAAVLFLVVVAVSVLAGMAQFLAQYIPLSVEQGVAERLEITQILDAKPLAEDDPKQIYVSQLAGELVARMALPRDMVITVHVVEGDTVNAYATLGGNIFVYAGLLQRMPHENALAMVLAHEIAHVRERHPIVALGRGLTVALALSAVFGLTDNAAAASLVEWIGIASTFSFSRDQERVADEVAASAMLDRYGHLSGAGAIFEVLGGERGLSQQGDFYPTFEFLDTHPGLHERVLVLEERAAGLGVSGPITALPWTTSP